MVEGNRNAFWVKDAFIEDVIEMRGHENFRTIRALVQEVVKNATKQASTICG